MLKKLFQCDCHWRLSHIRFSTGTTYLKQSNYLKHTTYIFNHLMFFNFNCYIFSATNCDCIKTSERQISPCNQYAKLLHCYALSCIPSAVMWRTEIMQKCRKWKKLMMPRLTHAKANKWKNKQKCTVVNWF